MNPDRLAELEQWAQEITEPGFEWANPEVVLELIVEVRRLQGEVERFRGILEKIVRLADEEALSAFISAWEFDSFRDDVDGEELLKEIRRVLGDAPPS